MAGCFRLGGGARLAIAVAPAGPRLLATRGRFGSWLPCWECVDDTTKRNLGSTRSSSLAMVTCPFRSRRVRVIRKRLPNGDKAEVDLRKLSNYRLSLVHPVGKHKAAVFLAALGLKVVDVFVLRGWLLRAASSETVALNQSDEYGDRYQLDFEASTPSGRAIIRSAWIIRVGEDLPRLTTCYVLPKGSD